MPSIEVTRETSQWSSSWSCHAGSKQSGIAAGPAAELAPLRTIESAVRNIKDMSVTRDVSQNRGRHTKFLK